MHCEQDQEIDGEYGELPKRRESSDLAIRHAKGYSIGWPTV